MAGSSHTVVSHDSIGRVRRIVTQFVGDDADGSVPNLTISTPVDAKLLSFTTDPGSPSPTDNYDIVMTDDLGVDQLWGDGVDRDTSNTEAFPILLDGSIEHVHIKAGTPLTIAITNQDVNSAQGRIIILYEALRGM